MALHARVAATAAIEAIGPVVQLAIAAFPLWLFRRETANSTTS